MYVCLFTAINESLRLSTNTKTQPYSPSTCTVYSMTKKVNLRTSKNRFASIVGQKLSLTV